MQSKKVLAGLQPRPATPTACGKRPGARLATGRSFGDQPRSERREGIRGHFLGGLLPRRTNRAGVGAGGGRRQRLPLAREGHGGLVVPGTPAVLRGGTGEAVGAGEGGGVRPAAGPSFLLV